MSSTKLKLMINTVVSAIILFGLLLVSFASFGNWIRFEDDKTETNTFALRYLAHPGQLRTYTENTYANSGIARWLRYLNLKYLSEIFIFQDEGYVIPGHGGMLFAFNDEQKTFYQKEPLFTDEELDTWTRVLSERKRWLALNGIDYYYLSVPNKSTVYAERVPGSIYRAKGPDRFDQLKARLQEQTDIPVIDIREDLIAAKPENLLYSLGDTHWNLYGAFVGYKALMERIQQDFPGIHVVDEGSLKLRASETRHSELGRIMRVNPLLKDDVLYYLPDYPPNYIKLELPRPYFSYTWPDWEPFQKDFAHATVAPGLDCPDVMVFHDSFFMALFFYISESFGRAAYIWNRNVIPGECPSRVDFQAVERERPRIVIEECVERFLSYGPATNPVAAQQRDMDVARILRYSPDSDSTEATPVEGAWLIHDLDADGSGEWIAAMGGWEGGAALVGSGSQVQMLPERPLWEPMSVLKFSDSWLAVGRSGSDGEVVSLRDGDIWEERFRLEGTYLATAVQHENILIVAGEAGSVYATEDGRSWQDISMTDKRFIRKLVSAGGQLCVLGDDGLVAFRGNSWTHMDGERNIDWKDAIYRNGEWILIGDDGSGTFVATAKRGAFLAEPERVMSGLGQAILEQDGSLWALVTDSSETRLLSSTDGRDWNIRKVLPEIWGTGLAVSGEDILVYGMRRFRPTEEPQLNRDLWQNVWDIGNGLEYLSWFGFFDNSKAPWFWHEDIGWFYSTSTSADSIWIYNRPHGYFYTDQHRYPQFLDKEENKAYLLKDGEPIPLDP